MGTAHSKLKGFTGAFAWFGADEIGRFLVPDDYRLFLLLCRRMYVLKQVLVGHVHNAESLDPSIPARQLNDRLRGEGDVEPCTPFMETLKTIVPGLLSTKSSRR